MVELRKRSDVVIVGRKIVGQEYQNGGLVSRVEEGAVGLCHKTANGAEVGGQGLAVDWWETLVRCKPPLDLFTQRAGVAIPGNLPLGGIVDVVSQVEAVEYHGLVGVVVEFNPVREFAWFAGIFQSRVVVGHEFIDDQPRLVHVRFAVVGLSGCWAVEELPRVAAIVLAAVRDVARLRSEMRSVQ